MIKTKIILTGIGGQGVVFLTELLVDAALRAGINVATSEIHGLSQRGGTVTAGVTFGKDTYGLVEEGGADFLLGLELLETQRCVNYLNKNSIVVLDDTKIYPYFVNAGKIPYPDTTLFIDFLKKNVLEVIFIKNIMNDIEPVMRNLLVLAQTVSHNKFPIPKKYFEEAISENSRGDRDKALKIFHSAFVSKYES